jgi:hypothetical protein
MDGTIAASFGGIAGRAEPLLPSQYTMQDASVELSLRASMPVPGTFAR